MMNFLIKDVCIDAETGTIPHFEKENIYISDQILLTSNWSYLQVTSHEYILGYSL